MFKILTNILFLLISSLLVTGGIFLSDASISESENRSLTSFPSVFTEKGLNREFGTIFEKALVDHLMIRDTLIDIHTSFLNIFNTKGNKNVLIGRNGWLFRNAYSDNHNFHNLNSYQRKIILTQQQKNTISHELKKTLDWAKKNNIKLYLIVPPEKPQIYAHYFPGFFKRRDNPPLNRQVGALMPKGITFIPMEEKLKSAVLNAPVPLYWKTDTHWNYSGAFIAYQELMRAIKRDFPAVTYLTRNDFDIRLKNEIIECEGSKGRGILYKMLKNPDYADETAYEFFTFKEPHTTKTIHSSIRYGLYQTPDALNHLNVVMYHDSYGNYMIDFLKDTFKNLRTIRFNPKGEKWNIWLDEEQQSILDFKPDILIFEISELKLIELTRMWRG